MGFPSFKFRQFITDEWVISEFDSLFAELRSLLSRAFDGNGDPITPDVVGSVEVGSVMAYAGPVLPSRWLLCDGSQVSRVTYKTLFERLGTTHGIGDGSTTFNLPDLRQRFVLGQAASGTGAALGSTGGAIDHTHTAAAHTHSTPAHSHSVSGSTDTRGSHSHTVDSHNHSVSDHSHSVSASGTTAATSDTLAANSDGGGITVANYTHTHSVSVSGSTDTGGPGATGNATPGTSSDGSHDHLVSGSTDSSGSGTTGSGGGSATTSNNPPFAVLQYMIFSGIA